VRVSFVGGTDSTFDRLNSAKFLEDWTVQGQSMATVGSWKAISIVRVKPEELFEPTDSLFCIHSTEQNL